MSAKIWVVGIFLHLSLVHGFLLDTNTAQPSNGLSKQCLTMAEFIDERDHLQRQFHQELSVLASQLKEKFATLEQTTPSRTVSNETCYAVGNLEKRVEELTLNYTTLQLDFASLQQKYNAQNEKLRQIQNKTRDFEMEIENLKRLPNIQPLHELNDLQKQLQSIDSQTQSLLLNEHARNDDFRALYNETISSKQKMTEMYRDFRDLTRNHTLMETRYNTLLAELQQKIQENSEKVALLSIGASNTYSGGSTIVFSTLHYSEGIPNSFLSTFKSTGIFTCEKGGLYLISANVMSSTSSSWFKIMKTGYELSRTFIADFSSGFQSSTGVVVATLNMHDTISVNAGTQMYVSGYETTLTLVKIK